MKRTASSRRRPHTRKPHGQGHERSGEMLAAAKALFLEEGYHNVTTRKIAERVGVSQTGFYVYFKSKDDILTAIRNESFLELETALRSTAEGKEADLALLHALCRAYVNFALSNRVEYQLSMIVGSIATPRRDPWDLRHPSLQGSPAVRAFDTLKAQIVRVMDGGHIKDGDPELVTLAIGMSLQGVCALLTSITDFPQAEAETLVDMTLDMIVKGLASV